MVWPFRDCSKGPHDWRRSSEELCPDIAEESLAMWMRRRCSSCVMNKLLKSLWFVLLVASAAAYIVPKQASLELHEQAIESGKVNFELRGDEVDAAELSSRMKLRFDKSDKEAESLDALFFCAAFAALLTAFGGLRNGIRVAWPGLVVVAGLLGTHSAVSFHQQKVKAGAYKLIVREALPSSSVTDGGVDWTWASTRAENEFQYDDTPLLKGGHHLTLWFLVSLFGWALVMIKLDLMRIVRAKDVVVVTPEEEPS